MKQLAIAALMSLTLFSVGCAHKHHADCAGCKNKKEQCACGQDKKEGCKDGECGMKKDEKTEEKK